MNRFPTIFRDFGTSIDALLISSMDAIIASGLGSVRGMIAAALSLYVLGFAFLTIYGKTDVGTAAMAAVRAVVVTQVLQAANYNFYVRDFFFTYLPNTIASALGGPRPGVSSAEQFDVLWSAALHATSIVLGQATGWSMVIERGMAWAMALAMLAGLLVIFLVWIVARVFMALIICMGLFIVLLFLFSATRGFVEQWIGKLVGLIVLQLTTSILLRILLVIISERMKALTGTPSGNLDVQLNQLAGIAAIFWMGAALMLILPAFMSIGSGVGAGAAMAAGSGMRSVGNFARTGPRQVLPRNSRN